MVLIKKYVDHGKNGLYLVGKIHMIDPELVFEISVEKNKISEIKDGLVFITNILPDGTTDREKKRVYFFNKTVKQMCEENLFIHFNDIRSITLTKFFEPSFRSDFWIVEDKIDLFLKVCERMYNKTDYNFVISIKKKDGSEKIRTFLDHSYLDYINSINNIDTGEESSYLQITIDNIKCYEPDVWIEKVEEMFYEVEDFAVRLNTIIEGFLNTPGMLFKKVKNGIPFGLWLVSQFIDTEDEYSEKIMVTKQKLGKLFFDSSEIFG